jgi:two-component system, cell cycle sensor histidine kinase and response regulator CckA
MTRFGIEHGSSPSEGGPIPGDGFGAPVVAFRELLDGLFEGCIVIDRQWRYAYLNEAAAGHDSRGRAGLLGCGVLETYPGFEHSLAYARFRRVMETGEPDHFEDELVFPDGSRAWFEFSVQAVPEGIFALTVDRTDRHAAEVALRASEERYRILADNVADVAFRGTNDGVLEWLSDSVTALSGWRPDQLVGRRFAELVHPDDADAVRAVQALVLAGEQGRFEARICTTSGGWRWVSNIVRPVRDETGAVVGRVGGWRDIQAEMDARQALAASERELQEAQRVAHVGSWRWDPVTDAAEWTDELFRIFGLEPAPVAPSREQQRAFLTPDTNRRLDAALADAVARGESYEIAIEIVRPDGEHRHAVARGEAVTDEHGRVTHVRGTLIDATERFQLEQERMDAIARLAAGVAHHINNSVMAINGTAELMAESIPADSPLRGDLAVIRESGLRAAALVGRLLRFGRRRTMRPEKLDLGSFLQRYRPAFRQLAGDAVELRVRAGADVPEVFVDPAALEEVVRILVTNARDAMSGGGTLTLSTSVIERTADLPPGVTPGCFGRLEVTDTGAGIEPESLPHLFDIFYTTQDPATGVGLGLSTAESIVTQSGGWIEVRSAPGEGSTFVVSLPAARG